MPQKGNENIEESVELEKEQEILNEEEKAEGETSEVEVESSEETPEAQVKILAEKNKELEDQVAELKDQFLRKQADFENFRKRMTREKEETVAYANQSLLTDLVQIIDDFERAIKSAEDSQDFQAFHDGIVMIEKQFTGMLERKYNLARFDSLNEEFDPQKHEAVMSESRADHENSMVLEEFQKGYMLGERVVRTSKVKVSIPGS